MAEKHGARLLRRSFQTLSLVLFFWLLLGAAWPLAEGPLPADSYLRLDPLVALLVPITVRDWMPVLVPGLVVIALTGIFGRFFCGYICPMGATLDLVRWVCGAAFGKRNPRFLQPPSTHWRKIKYCLLALMGGAALAGVNLYFWGSPIALITRFYGLLIHAPALLAGDQLLQAGRTWLDSSELGFFAYMALDLRRYDSLYFVLSFFGLLFVLELWRPRFWCRYFCPAGALLGLLSLRPFWKRRVKTCASCGRCVRQCPVESIAPDGLLCRSAECIVCRGCVDACPERGVFFSIRAVPVERKRKEEDGGLSGAVLCPLPSRRAFVGAAAAGVVLAAVQYSGAHTLLQAGNRGSLWSEGLVRPPGAVPEPDFLDLCLRCGECMKACPTNGLQPTWLNAGSEGIFSPVLMPRRGPCEPECNVCGQVCPTKAIQALPLAEKQWAKVGTAIVLRSRCLAWAEERRCVVCQESCPYGAVHLAQVEGSRVPVPIVQAARCFGCGYCEQHCPTRVPSIVVQPLNALRLNSSAYEEVARAAGLELVPSQREQNWESTPEGRLPPGFSE